MNNLENLEKKVINNELRITKLEEWKNTKNVDLAVTATNNQNIVKRLDAIEATVSRLFWIVMTAVLVAIVNFVLEGGLANVV